MKVLKFGAVWCPSCLIMKPRWAEIEEENDWLETEYYDYDQNLDKAKEYGVDDKLPIFIFLDNDGNELLRLRGEFDKKELLKVLLENKDK